MVLNCRRVALFLILVPTLVLGIARVVQAATAPTPQEIAVAAQDQMLALVQDYQNRSAVRMNDALNDLTLGPGAGDLTASQRVRGMANFVAVLQKDAEKTNAQIARIANRALARLQRLDADPQLISDLEFYRSGAVGTVNADRYFTARTVFLAVGEYANYIN